MITAADVEKLLAVRSAGPTVLSLYLGMPSHPPALRGLPARADELIGEAARADGVDAGQARNARNLGEDRSIVRRMLEVHARDWSDRTMAIFAGGAPGLPECLALPCLVADRPADDGPPGVPGWRRPLALCLPGTEGFLDR
jgi:hypothetical protein